MKRIILSLCLFIFIRTEAQQINPVPDYVFSNKMSVGRNAVTDTAAYFSIGPRYGAIRGMMPPMVTDTASMSATKRNGLLIFSIQKNKYLYWDSVGSKWAEMAGTAGSAITGSGVAGYMPEFTTSTNIDTTRLYHSAGRFAIGSTTTTNGVFNVYGGQAYFDTSLKVGSQTLLADEGKNEVYVNTTSDAGAYALQVTGAVYATGNLNFATGDISISNISNNVLAFGTNNTERMRIGANGDVAIGTTNADPFTRGDDRRIAMDASGISSTANVALSLNAGSSAGRGAQLYLGVGGTRHFEISSNSVEQGISAISNTYIKFLTNNTERMRLKADGEVLIGTTADAGAYALQVAGSIYNTTGAVFAASSGSVGIRTSSPGYTLDVTGDIRATNYVYANAASITPLLLNVNDADLVIQNSANKSLNFQTNNVERARIRNTGEFLIGYTASQGTYALQNNGNFLTNGDIRTAAPTGGTANDWRLGTVATVTPTSPNRTIEVSIGGTIYYIHAKTTND